MKVGSRFPISGQKSTWELKIKPMCTQKSHLNFTSRLILKAQWPNRRLLGSKMKIVGSRSSDWHTVRQNNKNVFCVIVWALCLLACRVTWRAPGWCSQASGSRLADCHSWLGEQGLCPSYPQMPPSSLLPMLGKRSQLKIMKIWSERGEAGREWRACSYFLIMKWLTFNSLTLENPSVKCFNKSKTWYKTEDSRFLLGLPTFFSCHVSQDRISPLEAAVYFKFQSQGLLS